MIFNSQQADLIVSAKDFAYSIVDWTVSGSNKLPPGVTYQIQGENLLFKGIASQIGLFSGITVTATDGVGATASLPISFNVIPDPNGIVLNVSNIRTKVGHPMAMVSPYADASLSTSNTYGRLLFSTQNAEPYGVTIDPATGALTNQATAVGDFTFNISVTDETDRIISRPVNVSVIPDLRLLVPEQVNFNQGESGFTDLATDYAIGAVSYEKGNGTWPQGITLNPVTGRISGTPTGSVATYSGLTIVGTDASGDRQHSNVFAIVVGPTAGIPSIQSPSTVLNLGMVTQQLSYTPVVLDGRSNTTWNAGPLTFTINKTLPSGLSFNASTGSITGSVTAPVDLKNVIITVQASNGITSSTSPFTLEVTETAVNKADETIGLYRPWTSTNLPQSVNFIASDYSYQGLPPGIVFTRSNGLLSGRASALGTYNVTVTAANGTVTVSKTFKMVVEHQPFLQVNIKSNHDGSAYACLGSANAIGPGGDISSLVTYADVIPDHAFNAATLADENYSFGSTWCSYAGVYSFRIFTNGQSVTGLKMTMRSDYNAGHATSWDVMQSNPDGSLSPLWSKTVPVTGDMRGLVFNTP
jgi:hypothetical protein